MKKLILLLFFGLSTIIYSTSYNTIDINGTQPGSKTNDWDSDEDFTDCSSADNAYLTWDASYIYFGVKDAEADYGNLATFMYFDIDPDGSNGTTDAYAWANNLSLPFSVDYVVVWKNESGADYIEVRSWNGSSWIQIASANSTSLNTDEVNFAIGTDYREVRIKRSRIGSPSKIKIASFTEQQYGGFWRYFTWPSAGWTDQSRGAGQSISHYRGYDLGSGFSPDAAAAYDGVLPVELTSFMASSKSKTVSLKWETATEVNNNGFEIERKSQGSAWAKVAFVQGHGNSNSTKNYSYTDKVELNGKYQYRLKQIDNDGTFEYSKTVEVDVNAVPAIYALEQNYPNPFNPSTTIRFSLPEDANIKLTVYNVLGQEVRSLINGFKPAGEHIVNFDAAGLNSGLYFYKLETAKFNSVRKMLLTK